MNNILETFFNIDRKSIDQPPFLYKFLLVASLFFSTLVNTYPGIPLIAISIFIFLCLYLRKVSAHISFQLLIVIFYFNLSAVIFYLGFGQSFLSREFFLDALLNNLIAVNVFLVLGFVISASYVKYPNFYAELFAYVLLIHISFIILQFLLNTSFGFFADYNQLLTGIDSRIYNYKCGEIVCTSNRYTGFFVEPSTFTSVITSLFILTSLHYQINRVGLALLIFSYFLAFSTAGLVQAILVMGIFLFYMELRRTQFVIAISSILIGFWIVISFILPYLLIGIEVSGGSRSRYFAYIFQNFDSFNYFFGSGIFDKEDDFFQLASGEMAQGRIASFNDLGTFIFVFVTGGISTLFILFFRIFMNFRSITIILLSTLFFSLKLGYHHAFFWIVLFSLSLGDIFIFKKNKHA